MLFWVYRYNVSINSMSVINNGWGGQQEWVIRSGCRGNLAFPHKKRKQKNIATLFLCSYSSPPQILEKNTSTLKLFRRVPI